MDFSHNLFKDIPSEVGNLELLKETKQWEVGIGLLKSLKKLNFSNCKLSIWPGQLELLILLETLDLSHNEIPEVAVFILGALRVLKYLNLSHNKLFEMPKEIYAVPLQVKIFFIL